MKRESFDKPCIWLLRTEPELQTRQPVGEMPLPLEVSSLNSPESTLFTLKLFCYEDNPWQRVQEWGGAWIEKGAIKKGTPGSTT
jgi:hypothetical protein